MVQTEQHRRLAWFIPIRLATFVILFLVAVLWMGFPRFLHLPFFQYAAATLAFTFLLAWDKRRRLRNVTETVVALHFLCEIAVESGIIYATGNLNSPFSALFILTIVSAALVYRMVGTLIVASLVSLAYTFIIWLGLSNSSGELSFQALTTIFETQETAFYSIFLHILIFYLVAFMSGYLAERLSSQDRQLADTSRALRQAKLETDDILRHLNSGLITVDADGRIVYFNCAAENILGYREEDVKGMNCREVFNERMPVLADSLMDGIQYRVAHLRREIEILSADGQPVPLGLSISILTEEDGATRGVIAIFSDLIDAKALEAKVRAADRLAAIGELSASIAHEIRNPLAAISGSVEVLKSEVECDGPNARLMELIIKESQRLNNILSEFLHYARIDRPAYNKVDLCRVVNDTLHILRHHPSFHRGIMLDFESDRSVEYVVGDEDLIKQLLLNLGVNAFEALGGEEGEVAFQLEETSDGDSIVLRVRDTGPGIPDELAARIYQPFFSTKKTGTGLGLAIVDRVCSALKLTLGLESKPGHGTTFKIEFPVYRPQPRPEDEPAASEEVMA